MLDERSNILRISFFVFALKRLNDLITIVLISTIIVENLILQVIKLIKFYFPLIVILTKVQIWDASDFRDTTMSFF